jgi:hypothetical protein
MSRYRPLVDVRHARTSGDDGVLGRPRGPARFAKALIARYRHGTRALPGLELSLAARQRECELVLHRHTLQALNPVRVVLQSVLQRVETAAAPARGEATLPVASNVAPIGRAALASAAAPLVAPFAAMPVLHQRLAARATRVETEPATRLAPALVLPAAGSTRAAPASTARLPDDLPLRQAPLRAPVVTPALTSTASDTGPTPPPRRPPSAPAPVLAPHEIERITEQVMTSLDRRILAERERWGRV